MKAAIANATAASHTDNGKPSTMVVASEKNDGGMSNSVPPLVAPTSMPRSTISMASVTMKAFSRKRTTRKPLIAPTTAPTARIASKPAAAGHCVPNPAEAAGITSIAPTAGAMPTVDSSDKSNLPVSTISDSASTTSASAADAPSTLIRFARVRKLGLTNAPITISSTSAGNNASSRKRASCERPRLPRKADADADADADACAWTWACAAPNAGLGTLFFMETYSFNGCNQILVLPSRGKFRGDTASEHDENTVTGAQIVEFAGHDQHGLAFFAHAIHDG